MKVIKADLFNIANRLKKLDKNYFIVFNKKLGRHEVHNKAQKGSTLAFILGRNLNAYAIKKALVTSCKNAKKILLNIQNANLKLEQQREDEFTKKHLSTLNSYLNYANSKSADVTF